MKLKLLKLAAKIYFRRKVNQFTLFWQQLVDELKETKRLVIEILKHIWRESTPRG